MAPRNQVHQEILQQIELDSEARNGSPLCVAFQADHRPGSSEHEGFFRAKMVFPEALIFETAQVPAWCDTILILYFLRIQYKNIST